MLYPQPAVQLNRANTGQTESGLNQIFDLIEKDIDKQQAETGQTIVSESIAAGKKKQ